MSVLLHATSISKSFAGLHALRNVSFDLQPGEVHALVGENGAGKSTFIKILTGAEQPDAGSLTLSGHTVSHLTPTEAQRLRVAAIYQQPSQFPDLTVAENIALALERGSIWRRVDWRARRRRAAALLDEVGATIDPDRLASSLSMPEQQIVEITKAIGADARIVVMDEPTASLTDHEVERLFGIIARLRAAGVGIIYISHRLEEVFAIASRITVLRDGQVVSTCEPASIDTAGLVRLMVGRDVRAATPSTVVTFGDVVLDVRRLSCAERGLRDVSIEVRAGEIVGLFGLVGSGRTELAETLFGLSRADAGEVRLRGQGLRIESPEQAIRAGLAYLPEDRLHHGVVADLPIAANVSLATLTAISRWGLLDRAAERSSAERWVERLRIKTPSAATHVDALSGGNQQKVALARWLETHPSVLLLDEPTQGVDVGSKAEIHALVRDLASRGLAIVMISSELPEILAMSDRIAVMYGGTIAGVMTRAEATEDAILNRALGHMSAPERRH